MSSPVTSNLEEGDTLHFLPSGRPGKREGRFIGKSKKGVSLVLLKGDPFAVEINDAQLRLASNKKEEVMATISDMNVKELRKRAVKYGIEGYEDMSIKDLRVAVKAASSKDKTKAKPKTKTTRDESEVKTTQKTTKTKVKPSTKKKTSTKAKPTASKNGAFRPGSQRAIIAEVLAKGGLVTKIRDEVKTKLSLVGRDGKPYPDSDKEILRRINMVAIDLSKDHGFTWEKLGEGKNLYWKVSQ